MYRRRKFPGWVIILATVLVVAALFIWTPLPKLITKAFGTVVSPIQSGINYVVTSVRDTFSYWGRINNVDAHNQELEKQVQELNTKLSEYENMKKENERLKELLEVKNRYDDAFETSGVVIAKDAGNWFNVFTVNRGTRDGINGENPVINASGLIGRTSETGVNWAKVVTLIDVNHSVSGKVSRTGDLVQVDGDLTLMKSGLCKMNIITEDADIIIGDVIETSGIGGVYPKGIKIGTVLELKQNDEGTGSYAVIKPAANFSLIDEVVILSSEDEVQNP